MISVSRRASRVASQPTPPRSAPVLSTTLTAAPAMKTIASTPAASTMPFGTATSAANGLTGLGVDAVIRAGHDHLAADLRVVAPLELPGGNDVGEDGGHEDAGREQRQGCRIGHGV